MPSPAFSTCASTHRVSCSGDPLEECRITIASAPIACRVSAVSFSDSPLATEEPPALKLITSADSRFAASSNEILVRVEFSRKKFTTVRPRSAGTFLITRVPTSRNEPAMSRILVTSSAVRSCIDSTCSFMRSCRSRRQRRGSPPGLHDDAVLAVDLPDPHPHVVGPARRHVLADEVGLDRQLAVSPVDEDREADPPGPPEIDQARPSPSGSSGPCTGRRRRARRFAPRRRRGSASRGPRGLRPAARCRRGRT